MTIISFLTGPGCDTCHLVEVIYLVLVDHESIRPHTCMWCVIGGGRQISELNGLKVENGKPIEL